MGSAIRLLAENGSGKVRHRVNGASSVSHPCPYPHFALRISRFSSLQSPFLQSIAERNIDIPEHIDIYLVSGEAEPSDVDALDYIVASAKQNVAKLEQRIEDLSVADDGDEVQLDQLYEELEDIDPSTFELKAGSILHGLGFSQQMMRKPTKDMSGG